MSSLKRLKRNNNKLRKIFTSLLVLAFFLFPVITAFSWARGALFGPTDTRKVAQFTPLNPERQNNLKPFREPIISVTFDDGWESVYSSALPLLQKYQVPTTQYILGSQFENTLYLSEAQVKSMQQAGHEIASHTMTHENLTAISESDRRWELGDSKKVLSEKFGPVMDFASPLGAEDEDTANSIKQFYRSNRNTEGDPETVGAEDINLAPNFDIYSINAFSVRLDTSIDEIKALIEYTQKSNGWLVLIYHQVDYSGAVYSVTPEMLEAQLKTIAESQTRLTTMGRTLDAIVREERNQ